MPRWNEIIRRPLEIIRRALLPIPQREEPLVRIFYPEAVDRVKEAAGYNEFGVSPPRVRETVDRSFLNEKTLVIRGDLQFSSDTVPAKTTLSATRQLHHILIPVEKRVFNPYLYARLERRFGRKFYVEGDPKIAKALYDATLDHAKDQGENDKAVPHTIHAKYLYYRETPDGKVEVFDYPHPNAKPAVLVTLHLEPKATDEELRAQIVEYIRWLYKHLRPLFEA